MKQEAFEKLLESQKHTIKQAKAMLAASKKNHVNIKWDADLVERLAGKLHYTSYVYGEEYSASIYLPDVTDMKNDPRLLALLTKALALCTVQETHDYAGEYSANRNFEFKLPRGGNLTIVAEVSLEAGGACKRVQIGIEMKACPKYALQCAESE